MDHLLDRGFSDLTVLDISGKALEKAQQRLGDRAKDVEWIEASATDFEAKGLFDVWHDRAVFHFLTTNYKRWNFTWKNYRNTWLQQELLSLGHFHTERERPGEVQWHTCFIVTAKLK